LASGDTVVTRYPQVKCPGCASQKVYTNAVGSIICEVGRKKYTRGGVVSTACELDVEDEDDFADRTEDERAAIKCDRCWQLEQEIQTLKGGREG